MNEIVDVNECNQVEVVTVDYGMSGLCGGVASLLKVLTKTMERQNSSATDIAKVQKAVCQQIGIMLPDVFIKNEEIRFTAVPIEVSSFFDERLTEHKNNRIKASDVYRSYVDYCEHREISPMHPITFGHTLSNICKTTQIRGARWIVGYKFKDVEVSQ